MNGILWFTVGLTFALLGHLIAWHFGRAAGIRDARHKTPRPTNQRRTSLFLFVNDEGAVDAKYDNITEAALALIEEVRRVQVKL